MKLVHTVNLNNTDINVLVAFIAIIEEGSVTGAAERIGRTQSAVSHALNRLRHMFNDPLLVRSGDRMEPTSKAVELYNEFVEPIRQIDAALHSAESFDPRTTERVFSLGMSDSVAMTVLPSLLAEFRIQAPYAKIRVQAVPSAADVDVASCGTLDAIVLSSRVSLKNMATMKVACFPFFCAYVQDQADPGFEMNMAEYLTRPHLLINAEGQMRGAVDKALQEKGLKRNVVATVPFYMVAPTLIANSDLVVSFAANMLPAFENLDRVRAHRLPIDVPPIELFMSFKRSAHSEGGLSWLLGIVETAIANVVEVPLN